MLKLKSLPFEREPSAALILSILIPAHNEEGCIEATIRDIWNVLTANEVSFDVLVVNDHSSDRTAGVLDRLCTEYSNLSWKDNLRPAGFGHAIRTGLEAFTGDAVCIVMADASDDPNDIVCYYKKLCEGYDCVFGSRFIRGARVVDYPKYKLFLNRMANWFIQFLFVLSYDDVTNAFKCFRREVISGVSPILSHHFNITVELPLKAIVRGYTYAVVPNNWFNRKAGESKFRVQEMGSRYLFIVLYVLIEKWLSRGDYRRKEQVSQPTR